MHGLDWNDLQYILAVAEHGSLTAAARALQVSHTTVLRRVAGCERRLGVRLFERLPTGHVPTAAGDELAQAARAVDERVRGLERRLMGQDLRLQGTLRIATTDTLALTLLPRHLATFSARHPEVQLELTVSNAMVNLTKRDADIAVRPSARPPEHLIGRRVAAIAFAPYAAPAYLARHPARRELARHLWLAPDDSLAGTLAARWLREQVPALRPVLRADSLMVLRDAALAGLGAAVLPCYLADPHPGLRRLRAPGPALESELWLLTHADLRGTARVRALLEHLGAAFAGERDLLEGRAPAG